MVDLHTHILPFIDDGASSFEESINMLKMMIKNGVTTAVATPHFNFEKNNVDDFLNRRNDSLSKLKLLSEKKDLPIQILSGAELMYTPNLENYNLNDFTIEGTDYILIELSTRRNEPNLEDTLSAIIANGYIPILAHIERYSYLIQNSHRIVTLIEMGVLMQVNAKSVLSSKSYPFIEKLLSNNLVHLIGSDAHDLVNRAPNLEINKIKPHYIKNQKSVIENSIVNVNRPKKLKKIFNVYF